VTIRDKDGRERVETIYKQLLKQDGDVVQVTYQGNKVWLVIEVPQISMGMMRFRKYFHYLEPEKDGS